MISNNKKRQSSNTNAHNVSRTILVVKVIHVDNHISLYKIKK